MSLVVSSTTDSQEAVNAAAGLPEAGAPPAPAESTAPSPAPEPEAPEPKPEEPKQEAEPESEEPGEEPEAPRKKQGGFQRKIERLEQQLEWQEDYSTRRIRELEAQLARERPGEPPKPQAQTAPPKEEEFTSYPEYIRAAARWEARQELLEQQEVARQAAAEWQQQQQQAEYEQKLAAFTSTVDDFDERIRSVRHIRFAKDINAAIQESEIGPQLAYELARKPEELMRLAKLPVRSAIREIGKFEAQLLSRSTNGSEGAKPVAHSQAPPPIRPVGSGGPTATKRPDEMSFQEYKAWHRQRYGRR